MLEIHKDLFENGCKCLKILNKIDLISGRIQNNQDFVNNFHHRWEVRNLSAKRWAFGPKMKKVFQQNFQMF